MAAEDEAPAMEVEASIEPDPRGEMMARVDAALAPAASHSRGIGTASLSDLGVIVAGVRAAFNAVIYPDPATVEPEPAQGDPEPEG